MPDLGAFAPGLRRDNSLAPILLRPTVMGGGIFTQTFDQAGKVDSNAPGQAAASFPWGSWQAQAWAYHQMRLFYRLEIPLKRFILFMEDSPYIVDVNEPRAHKLFVEAITDATLDLNNVTWNNQDDLTYENPFAAEALPEFMRIDMSVAGGSGLTNYTRTSPASRYNASGFRLVSQKFMYGFRFRWDGDTEYTGAEEAHFKHISGIRLFYTANAFA